MAFLHCEQQFGAAWVHAPGRWATSDGCVPHTLVWYYFGALSLVRAATALDTARGIGLAFASESAGQRPWTSAFDEAYPDVSDAE